MPTDDTPPSTATAPETPQSAAKRPLPAAAQRALAEAAERRAQAEHEKNEAPKEISGRGGLDPTRYGDWEINGLIADF